MFTKVKRVLFANWIAESVRISSKCPALRNKTNPIVSPIDCKHHLEACAISFIVETSLPLSSSKTNWIDRNLFRNCKALSQLKLNRTVASYKFVDKLNFFGEKKSTMQRGHTLLLKILITALLTTIRKFLAFFLVTLMKS